MPSASQTISSQSRNKLKTFQFVPNENTDRDNLVPYHSPENNKENQNSNDEGGHPVANIQTQQDTEHRSSQSKSSDAGKQCPQTPARNRIPLSDLIRNTEDALNKEPNAKTPDDQVYWQHGPRSSDRTTSSRSSKRGKKRARSSSPSSSSQIERVAHISARPDAMDLHHLHQLLRTPQADPAIDLWNRYADTTLGTSADRNALPSVAHLVGASPHTPGVVGSKESTGLRRSISCGTEWPSSKAKRRKTNPVESFNRVRDLFVEHKDAILGSDQQKISKVGLLVEKIQDSMARHPTLETSGPSSSSPLPERNDTMAVASTPSRPERSTVTFTDLSETRADTANQPEQQLNAGRARKNASSEFGGDELDIGFLESIELGSQHKPGVADHAHVKASDLQPQQVRAHTIRSDIEQSTSEQIVRGSRAAEDGPPSLCARDDAIEPGSKPETTEAVDEFDDDGIFLGADIERMMADNETMTYDTGKGQRTETADASFVPELNLDPIVIDEFDDGFEDDDEVWTQLGNSANVEVSKERLAPHAAPSPVSLPLQKSKTWR